MTRMAAWGGRGLTPVALSLAVGAAACSDDPAGPGTPRDDEVATITVNAESWAYVDLADPAKLVTIEDPATSPGWDIAFNATAVMLNGGAAGPGGVRGYCVCRNSGATDAQVAAMTPESELEDFLAVTAADVPTADEDWESDALVPVISGWYAYDPSTHRVSAVPGKVWKVRAAEGVAYAKLRVTAIEGASRENAGRVTIEFAVQAEKGGAMGPVRTATVDLSSGDPVHFDLVAGAVSDASDWDLRFEGYTIRVNGGVSGSGQAGAVAVDEPFEAIADASDMDRHYAGDTFGGVFSARRWYRYNVTGTDHQIWPTYDVYLIERGGEVYKVQLIGYYGPAGEPRRITMRYARLAGA